MPTFRQFWIYGAEMFVEVPANLNPNADYTVWYEWLRKTEQRLMSDFHALGVAYFHAAAAASEAAMLKALPWREREGYRQGRSRQLPVWHEEKWWIENETIWRDHFLHVAEGDRTLLAYTQDAKKGERDIQTPIKPGRYLRKFFSSVLTEKQIAAMADWQNTGNRAQVYADANNYTLAFARRPDEIVSVYERGPYSCMHGEDCVRVYGAGDLAVAYLADAEGNVVARALVWPDKKVCGRVYPTVDYWNYGGDRSGHKYTSRADAEDAYTSLRERLRAAGYSFDGGGSNSFKGARLLKIDGAQDEDGDDAYVMPYLDHGYKFSASRDSRFWIMDYLGDYGADRTDGTAHGDEGRGFSCDNCGDRMRHGDENTVYTRTRGGRPAGEQTWCQYCCDYHGWRCDETEEMFSESVHNVTLQDGRTVLRIWAIDNATHSDLSDEYFTGDAVEMADGGTWSASEFSEHGFVCAITGDNYAKAEAHPDYPAISADCDAEQIADWLAQREASDAIGCTIADDRQHTLNMSGELV